MEQNCKKRVLIVPDQSLNQGPAGPAGVNGQSQFLYIGYASDALGSDFSLTPAANLPFISLLVANVVFTPTVANFVNGWFRYLGTDGVDGADGADGAVGPQGIQGLTGNDGQSAFVYIAYADDVLGTGFTTIFNPTKTHIAIRTTTTEIPSPMAGDFAGLWAKYIGDDGADGATGSIGPQGPTGPAGVAGTNGTNAFLYVAYADDELGNGFSFIPQINKRYIAILNTDTEILTPVSTDFTGLWVQYQGQSDIYSTSSTSSLTIGTGSKSLIVDMGLAWRTGQPVVIARTGISATRMVGLVDTYDSLTGAMSVTIDTISGTGTFNVWSVGLNSAAPPASQAFDWNRNIKTLPAIGENHFLISGAGTVAEGLESIYFRFLSAVLNLNAFPLQEVGADYAPNIVGTLTPNDETIITDRRIIRDPNGTPVVIDNPAGNNINFVDANISIVQGLNQEYQLEADVDNNGNPTTIQSQIRGVNGIFPFLFGMNPSNTLTGTALYSALTKLLETQSSKTVTLNGNAAYIYFLYDASYPDLTSILDQNGFEILGATFPATSTLVSVTSVGLGVNYTQNFKAYISNLTTVNNAPFQFIF